MPGPLLALIPLAISAATSIYQGVKGAKQKREAAKLQQDADEQERNNKLEAQRMALQGLPAAEYQRAYQQINRSQSGAINALRDRRMALAGATSVQQSTNDALQNLAAADANARRNAENVALNQANRKAGLDYNRANQMRQGGEALTGAALQNIYNTGVYGAQVAGDALSGNGGSGGLFGNSADGSINRRILGTNSIYGGNAYGGGYSALNNKFPTSVNYARPY